MTTYDHKIGRWVENQPFKMFYVRPGLFRFEWIDYAVWEDGESRTVWSDGVNASTYWQTQGYEKHERLAFAIASATGISGGAAHTVPRLLMDDIGGISLADLTNLTLIGEGKLEDEVCYKIKSNFHSDVSFELWIGKKSYLLRKVTTKYNSAIRDEIHRNIKINQPIQKSVFNFTPPIPLGSGPN